MFSFIIVLVFRHGDIKVIKISNHCGLYQPWVDGPAVYKKEGWPSYVKQTSKEHPSKASALAPISRFLP